MFKVKEEERRANFFGSPKISENVNGGKNNKTKVKSQKIQLTASKPGKYRR